MVLYYLNDSVYVVAENITDAVDMFKKANDGEEPDSIMYVSESLIV